ncbi:MAG: hypothetical protein IJQ54_05125 [Kiritimatiellae bacterium]|nr:hypothetical protein [Kiritimatiellia bacterium]MBR0241892.1 hypothetical protein [Kiritimatiellia bacterium]
MNASSYVVLAVVGILFALAVWRVAKKGAPCECGGSRKVCSRKSGCSCCDCCGD